MESVPRDTVRASIDGDQSPSMAIVRAVAALTGSDPRALPPLYDTTDPDALDALFAKSNGGTLVFEYAETTVTVEDGAAVTATLS